MAVGLETQSVAMGTDPNECRKPRPPAPACEDIAKQLPQFEVVELIGQGGMGAVYKARQRELDRWVALKILPRQASTDPAFAERFATEARALARLNHPNIVTVHEFGQADGLYLPSWNSDGLNRAMLAPSGRPKEAMATP
jgi:serine/threonine protein kinase